MVWEVRKRGGFDLDQDAGGDREPRVSAPGRRRRT